MSWKLSVDEPLMLVLAICRMSRVHGSDQHALQDNVLRFDIAEYRMWLSGYVGFIDAEGKRDVTSHIRSPVRVAPLASEVWHNPGERLEDYADG